MGVHGVRASPSHSATALREVRIVTSIVALEMLLHELLLLG